MADSVYEPDDVRLHRVARIHDAPPFVKAASRRQLCGDDLLPAHLYADRTARRWPMHTAAATWASAADFLERRGGVDGAVRAAVARRLDEAAGYWGIRGAVDALVEKAAARTVADDDTLPDDAFAVVMPRADAPPERHLRLLNAPEVKVAAAWLRAHRDDFLYEDRCKIARRILARGTALDVVLDDAAVDFLQKTAGYGCCATEHAHALLQRRAALVGGGAGDDLRALARDLADVGGAMTHDPAFLGKVAAAVDKVDRVAGLVGRYGADVARPEEVLFAVTAKAAAEYVARHVVTPAGATYARAALSRLATTAVRDHMGTEFADAVADTTGLWLDATKLASVLEAAPPAEWRAFEQMLCDLDVAPVRRATATQRALPSVAALVAALD